MSRRLNRCRVCPGWTRHDDRVCSSCRTMSPTARFATVTLGVDLTSWQRGILDATDRLRALPLPLTYRGRGG